jgi:hypothetical protein
MYPLLRKGMLGFGRSQLCFTDHNPKIDPGGAARPQ